MRARSVVRLLLAGLAGTLVLLLAISVPALWGPTPASRAAGGPTVIATVRVGWGGHYPAGVAVNPSTNHIYVSHHAAGVYVIDGADDTVETIVPVGADSAGIAFNPANGHIYVANRGSNNVSVIDGATNNVVATVPVVTGAGGVAVEPDTNRVYVTNLDGDDVSVIDASTDTVIATVPVGGQPWAVAVNPVLDRAYVANLSTSNLSVIDTASNTVIATVPISDIDGGVNVNPSTGRIYVTHSGNKVSVLEEAMASATPTPTPTRTPTPITPRPPGVGGTVKLPPAAVAAEASAPARDSGWTFGAYAALAGAAAAIGVGGWYARRRWLR